MRERNEIALLLRFGSEEVEGHRAERNRCGERNGRRCIGARDLHDRERVARRVAAHTAVFFRKREAEEAELGHFGRQIVGEALLAIHFLGLRAHLAFGEFPCKLLDCPLLRREVEVHRPEV